MAGAAAPAPAPRCGDGADRSALEAEGIPVRLGPGDLVAIGDVTGLIAPVDSCRAIRFLPAIAQRDRRPMLNALRYYQRHNPFGSYLRYAVVTAGQRVPFGGDLRGQVQQLHRLISRFAYEARRQFGVEVSLPRDGVSRRPGAQLSRPRQPALCPRRHAARRSVVRLPQLGHRFFGVPWRDNGRLVKPEEAIRYPFKPAELERLEGPAIAWIYRGAQRLKLAQPLGEFAAFWRELDRRRLEVLLVDGPGGGKLCIVERSRRPVILEGCRTSRRRGEPATENEVICQMAPQSRFCPRAESVTLVRNVRPYVRCD
jgi:hypothetical protein